MSASPSSCARASFADVARRRLREVRLCAAIVVAGAALVASCRREPVAAPRDASVPDASAVDTSEPATAFDAAREGDASDSVRVDDRETGDAAMAAVPPALLTGRPRSGKSIGHTSVVFKLRFDDGTEAAFKPRSRRGGARYRGEIAAYRLGVALGIENVPPALPRSFDAGDLRAALGSEPLFAEEVLASRDGRVDGAILPWIKGLSFLDLERDPWLGKWRGWLAHGGVIPEDERRTAAAISSMIVFDYVTGNWDRWSGGNVGFDRARDTVLFIDNDGAFYDPPPAAALARQTTILARVDRFSARFVAALRALEVARALGEERPGEPLLGEHNVASVEARRRRALAVIEAKIAAQGGPAVLAFE
jgi:hypothetical protein